MEDFQVESGIIVGYKSDVDYYKLTEDIGNNKIIKNFINGNNDIGLNSRDFT